MLNPKQKEKLKNRKSLSPKDLANFNYQIAQKMEKILSELEDVNEILASLPERTAEKRLNDKMVISILRLTESILKILNYTPLEEGPRGQLFINLTKEIPTNDNDTQKFETERRPPKPKDVARHILLVNHINKLNQFAFPADRVPLKESLDFPKLNSQVGKEGYELYEMWMRQG